MNELRGYLSALTSTMLWGSSFIAARYLLAFPQKADPLFMVFGRFAIAALFLFLLAVFLKKDIRIKSKKQLWEIFRAAFFLYWAMSLLLFIGQKSASATTGALFLESGPAILTILWKSIRREKTAAIEYVGCILCFIGCMMVLNILTPDGLHFEGNWFGQLMLLLAAVSWVAGSIFTCKLMLDSDKLVVTAWLCLAAALLTLPVMGIFHDSLIIPQTFAAWAVLFYFGVFPTAAAFFLWNLAMLQLPLWKLNLMQNLTPLFTLTGAYFLLGETISLFGLLGIIIVSGSLSAVMFLTAKRT